MEHHSSWLSVGVLGVFHHREDHWRFSFAVHQEDQCTAEAEGYQELVPPDPGRPCLVPTISELYCFVLLEWSHNCVWNAWNAWIECLDRRFNPAYVPCRWCLWLSLECLQVQAYTIYTPVRTRSFIEIWSATTFSSMVSCLHYLPMHSFFIHRFCLRNSHSFALEVPLFQLVKCLIPFLCVSKFLFMFLQFYPLVVAKRKPWRHCHRWPGPLHDSKGILCQASLRSRKWGKKWFKDE